LDFLAHFFSWSLFTFLFSLLDSFVFFPGIFSTGVKLCTYKNGHQQKYRYKEHWTLNTEHWAQGGGSREPHDWVRIVGRLGKLCAHLMSGSIYHGKG
jgi:hypothetical protein